MKLEFKIRDIYISGWRDKDQSIHMAYFIECLHEPGWYELEEYEKLLKKL